MSRPIHITDHAMLRYIERVMGVDMAQVRENILPRSNQQAVRRLGSGSFPIGEHRIVVKGGRIVTVKNNQQKGGHK
jgi:hypothetical protein